MRDRICLFVVTLALIALVIEIAMRAHGQSGPPRPPAPPTIDSSIGKLEAAVSRQLALDAVLRAELRIFAQTRIAPDQLKAPRFVALACVAPATASSNCAGLVYIDAVTPAGTEIKIIGAPVTVPIDPAAWSLIP